MNKALLACLVASVVLAASILRASEPEVTSKDLPRAPLVAPADATRTIRVKKGFHMELVAFEPSIASPVAMCFDERGRLFVAEMIDYSERRDERPHLGRIRLLEDTKGTGVFDKSTIYADNLAWPTAVFCYQGGVFVGSTPDILYLKDTIGDGKADLREVVFTGFAAGRERLNVQELLNSFIWGLDNRIHGSTSGEGGMVKPTRRPGTPAIDLRGRDFVIEPRSMSMTSEAGGGQHGLSFDDVGRRFTCNNSDHLRLFMYDDRYAARNPYYSMPACLESIAVDGPAAEIYRLSPEEPWRVLRTRWRVAGLVEGPIEGGGRSSGYFTGATGSTIYRGSAFPEEFRGNAFIGECGGNLLHRKLLFPDDVGLQARRPLDEQGVEFLASTDNWFRPVQFANAPDGTLYLIDMHREIVEHPWSLPDGIKNHLDLNSGSECGRIFRIVPDGFVQPPPPALDRASTPRLVAALENPNGWHRDTASRLLYERRDASAVPLLARLLETSPSPVARIHALHALEGLDSLQTSNVFLALADPEPWVRVHALRLAEKLSPAAAPEVFERILRMAADPSNLVRYQLAFTLGEFPGGSATAALAQVARRDAGSRWIRAAVLSSLATGADQVFADLSADPTFTGSVAGREFLVELASLVGAKKDPAAVAGVLAFSLRTDEAAVSFPLVRALGEGLRRAHASFDSVGAGDAVGAVFSRALTVARDRQTAESARVEAIQLLALTESRETGPVFDSLLEPAGPESIQLAGIAALARSSGSQVSSRLVGHWAGLSRRARSRAMTVLLSRPERALVLLQAVDQRIIQPSELDTSQVKFLRAHPNQEVRRLAVAVLGAAVANQRQAVVEAYQSSLALRGDPGKGRAVYLQRCAACHRLGGAGFAVGPDLVTVKNAGKEKLLVSILDPSREVAPPYIAFEIETKDGETLVGILSNETLSSLTVRQGYGKEEVIPRANVRAMRSQGQSLMPEGLEQGLSPQDIADLLEFISTAGAEQ